MKFALVSTRLPELPAELDDLLKAAATAQPGVRIEYRDRIAADGAKAIPALTEWLADPRLGAFAVRTLERIAGEPADHQAVIDVFAQLDRQAIVGKPIAVDVSEAMTRLGWNGARSGGRGKASPRTPLMPWPGSRSVSPLELRFHDEMVGIFRLAGEATRRPRADGTVARGYWASYFLRGVRNHGGLEYARQLLRREGTTEGFQRLTDEGRLDLTVEALVGKPEYAELFSADERRIAAHRLAQAGYQRR